MEMKMEFTLNLGTAYLKKLVLFSGADKNPVIDHSKTSYLQRLRQFPGWSLTSCNGGEPWESSTPPFFLLDAGVL